MKHYRLRKLLGALATCGVIALLSVALLEVLVRVAAPQEAPSLWLTPDARYGHLMKPNFQQSVPFAGGDFVMDVQTNSLGFRDGEPAPRETGVPTVVFAGDSFTFGHGIAVEDRFDTLTCAQLRQARCINAGVNAWGTLQQTRFLRDHLELLQPDCIVLTFCENDPHDDTYFLNHGISFDRVRFPGKDFLRAHSHLFRLAQHLYLQARKRAQFAEQAPAEMQEATRQRAAAEGATAQAFAPPIADSDWQRTEGYLRDFMAAYRAWRPAATLVLQTTDPLNDDIRMNLARFAAAIPGVTFVDWKEAAAALSLAERRLPYDGHWSVRMHQLSAEALAPALKEMLSAEATD